MDAPADELPGRLDIPVEFDPRPTMSLGRLGLAPVMAWPTTPGPLTPGPTTFSPERGCGRRCPVFATMDKVPVTTIIMTIMTIIMMTMAIILTQ